MQIRVLSETSEFKNYDLGWDRLGSFCNLFTLKEWLFSWWEQYKDNKQLRIYIVEDDNGSPLAMLPMMVQEKDGKSLLIQLAAGGADFFGVICDPAHYDAINLILRYVHDHESYDRFVLTNLRLDEMSTTQMIRAAMEVYNDINIVVQGKVFRIDTTSDYDEYYRQRSKNFRHRFNRIMRNEGKYVFSVETEYSNKLIEEIFRLHKARWRDDMQLSVFYDTRRTGFVDTLFRFFSEKSMLRVYTLRDGDDLIAYRAGFVYKDIYHDWNTAFDTSYSADSVGMLLCNMLVKSCFESEIRQVDFLLGEEGYKKEFSTGTYSYIAIDFKVNKALEEYFYIPPIQRIQKIIPCIENVVFLPGEDDIQEDNTLKGRFVDFVQNKGIVVMSLDEKKDSYSDEGLIDEDRKTLVIGSDLDELMKASRDIGAVSCLILVDDSEKNLYIDERPDMVVDGIDRLKKCFEDWYDSDLHGIEGV